MWKKKKVEILPGQDYRDGKGHSFLEKYQEVKKGLEVPKVIENDDKNYSSWVYFINEKTPKVWGASRHLYQDLDGWENRKELTLYMLIISLSFQFKNIEVV